MYYGPRTVTSGLVLALDAANRNSYISGSNTWRDLSGINNNGTLTNGPTFSSANGGSIVFDGVDDYTVVNNSTSLQITDSITLSCWMYITSAKNGLGLITKGPVSSDYDYMLYITTNSTIAQLYKKNSSGTVEFSGFNSVFINNWVNIVFTLNNLSVTGYENGIIKSTGTFVNSGIRSSTQDLLIARGWGQYFPGNLSNVLIYNRALSATEVLQNYNATKARFGR